MIRIISAIVVMIFCVYFIYSCLRYLGHYNNEMKTQVGNKIVIEKDTLIILYFSSWDGSYNLSNGSKISKELLTKYPIIKK